MGTRTNKALMGAGKRVPKYPGKEELEAFTQVLFGRALQHYAGHQVKRLAGFWFLVTIYGGFEAYRRAGLTARQTAYGERDEFEAVFGVDVEEWLPELAEAIREISPPPKPAPRGTDA